MFNTLIDTLDPAHTQTTFLVYNLGPSGCYHLALSDGQNKSELVIDWYPPTDGSIWTGFLIQCRVHDTHNISCPHDEYVIESSIQQGYGGRQKILKKMTRGVKYEIKIYTMSGDLRSRSYQQKFHALGWYPSEREMV